MLIVLMLVLIVIILVLIIIMLVLIVIMLVLIVIMFVLILIMLVLIVIMLVLITPELQKLSKDFYFSMPHKPAHQSDISDKRRIAEKQDLCQVCDQEFENYKRG